MTGDQMPLEIWASQTLQSMREEIIVRMQSAQEEVQAQDPTTGGDPIDQSSAREECEQLMNSMEAMKVRLAEIDAAIHRVKSGDYGICEGTGEEIPRERLAANPIARYTLQHQSRLEHLSRQRGRN